MSCPKFKAAERARGTCYFCKKKDVIGLTFIIPSTWPLGDLLPDGRGLECDDCRDAHHR